MEKLSFLAIVVYIIIARQEFLGHRQIRFLTYLNLHHRLADVFRGLLVIRYRALVGFSRKGKL